MFLDNLVSEANAAIGLVGQNSPVGGPTVELLRTKFATFWSIYSEHICQGGWKADLNVSNDEGELIGLLEFSAIDDSLLQVELSKTTETSFALVYRISTRSEIELLQLLANVGEYL